MLPLDGSPRSSGSAPVPPTPPQMVVSSRAIFEWRFSFFHAELGLRATAVAFVHTGIDSLISTLLRCLEYNYYVIVRTFWSLGRFTWKLSCNVFFAPLAGSLTPPICDIQILKSNSAFCHFRHWRCDSFMSLGIFLVLTGKKIYTLFRKPSTVTDYWKNCLADHSPMASTGRCRQSCFLQFPFRTRPSKIQIQARKAFTKTGVNICCCLHVFMTPCWCCTSQYPCGER